MIPGNEKTVPPEQARRDLVLQARRRNHLPLYRADGEGQSAGILPRQDLRAGEAQRPLAHPPRLPRALLRLGYLPARSSAAGGWPQDHPPTRPRDATADRGEDPQGP